VGTILLRKLVKIPDEEAEGRRLRGSGQEAPRQEAEGRRLRGRRQKAEVRRQEAEGRSQEAEGRRQEAGGRRQKSGGRRQEAEGRRQKAVPMKKFFTTMHESPSLRVSASGASPRLFQVRRGEGSHTSHTHHRCHINYKSSLMVVSTFSSML